MSTLANNKCEGDNKTILIDNNPACRAVRLKAVIGLSCLAAGPGPTGQPWLTAILLILGLAGAALSSLLPETWSALPTVCGPIMHYPSGMGDTTRGLRPPILLRYHAFFRASV